MSTVLWIIGLVLIGMAFMEGATQGILAVLGILAFVFVLGALGAGDSEDI
jgi:hypothetical protein